MITITAQDALRSENIPPGWYDGECIDYVLATASTDGSAVHKFSVQVVIPSNPIPIPTQEFVVSKKAPGMGKAFFIACGFPKEEWEKLVKGELTSQQIDPRDCVGKKFRVFISNEKFGNRMLNKPTDFMSAK